MPELPEVETVRRGLEPAFAGATFAEVEARRGDLRFPFPPRFAERLEGRRVLALRRRAKYLLADLDSGETLVMHMGMSGSFQVDHPPRPELVEGRSSSHGLPSAIERPSRPLRGSSGRGQPSAIAEAAFQQARSKDAAHDHVVFRFADGARVVYNDPRRFGFMTLIATGALDDDRLFAGLGIEPLSEAFDAAALGHVLEGVRAPLKSALIDQRRIAGLGNIYVCEALHRARLSPLREAGSVPRAKIEPLCRAIRAVLEEAIEAGGSTLRDHRQADGTLGYFQHAFAVYDREGAACPRKGCSGAITRIAQNGRSTFYCPQCQR